jgi:hypothetical protein
MRTNISISSTKFAKGKEVYTNGEKTQGCAQNGPASCPSDVPFVEHRRNPRWPFTASVSVLEPVSGAHIEAHTADLGPGGCFLDTMNSFPPGTKVQMRMTKDGRSIEADAVVAYSQVGVGMGLSLTTVAPGHRAVLDHWYAELRGEVRPAPHTLNEVKEVQASNILQTETDYALEELLVALMRKGLLTEEEGEPILRRLLHGGICLR